MDSQGIQIGFGGGCHWCTEAVFAVLQGVTEVKQGFISSHAPNDSYSEAVLIKHDEHCISLDSLVEIHLRTHASTSSHSMRKKYRSAIYVNSTEISARCELILKNLQSEFDKPLVTQVLGLVDFKPSAETYKDYYASNPNRPFCVTYIDPKLALLKRNFASLLTDDGS